MCFAKKGFGWSQIGQKYLILSPLADKVFGFCTQKIEFESHHPKSRLTFLESRFKKGKELGFFYWNYIVCLSAYRCKQKLSNEKQILYIILKPILTQSFFSWFYKSTLFDWVASTLKYQIDFILFYIILNLIPKYIVYWSSSYLHLYWDIFFSLFDSFEKKKLYSFADKHYKNCSKWTKKNLW